MSVTKEMFDEWVKSRMDRVRSITSARCEGELEKIDSVEWYDEERMRVKYSYGEWGYNYYAYGQRIYGYDTDSLYIKFSEL